MKSNLTKEAKQMLAKMEDTFKRVGYCNSGAVTPTHISERAIFEELMDKGLIERRVCRLEMYQLTKATRQTLAIKYDLIKAWGNEAEKFHVYDVKSV